VREDTSRSFLSILVMDQASFIYISKILRLDENAID
jgi:hypothetical protein